MDSSMHYERDIEESTSLLASRSLGGATLAPTSTSSNVNEKVLVGTLAVLAVVALTFSGFSQPSMDGHIAQHAQYLAVREVK